MRIQGNITKILLSFGLVAFLFLGAFNFSHAGMTTGMDGEMIDCPFTPGVSICEMNPLEMIAASQSLLTTLPQQKDLFSVLMLLIAAAFLLLVSWKPFVPRQRVASRIFIPRRDYTPFSNPLQELFSNGILNPKLY
jgi:hypothetical protein